MRKYRKTHPEKWSTAATRSVRLKHYYKHRDKLLAQGKKRREFHQTLINEAKSYEPEA